MVWLISKNGAQLDFLAGAGLLQCSLAAAYGHIAGRIIGFLDILGARQEVLCSRFPELPAATAPFLFGAPEIDLFVNFCHFGQRVDC